MKKLQRNINLKNFLNIKLSESELLYMNDCDYIKNVLSKHNQYVICGEENFILFCFSINEIVFKYNRNAKRVCVLECVYYNLKSNKRLLKDIIRSHFEEILHIKNVNVVDIDSRSNIAFQGKERLTLSHESWN